MFKQPTAEDYGRIGLKLQKNTSLIIKNFIKNEGLDALKDFGFDEGTPAWFLRENSENFDGLLHGTKEIFPDE